MSTTKTCGKSYIAESRYCNFYAGGDVFWTTDGKQFYCQNTKEVTVVDVPTGQVVRSFCIEESTADDEDVDIIICFSLSQNNKLFVTAHRSCLLRLWSVETGKIEKIWKAQHKGVVINVAISPCCKLICTSGSDSTLRIWHYINNCCLAVFKDFSGPALLLKFHPYYDKTEIFVAGADNAIYCWNYSTKTLLYKLRGHLSQITGISFENEVENCEYIASVSRDKVLIIWRLSDGTQFKVIPVYEELQGVIFLTNNTGITAENLLIACSNGNLKLVNYKTATISTLGSCDSNEISKLVHCKKTGEIAVITADHNIIVYWLEDKETQLNCIKQLIGFNDEILDICLLGEEEQYLAVATNSNNIKLYDTASNMNCKLITGHADIVMSLSSVPKSNYMLSTGKDFTIILWELDKKTFSLNIITKNPNSHTSNIGSISFAHKLTNLFASACQNGTLKVWHIKQKNKDTSFILKYSVIAHDKEVNCVTFSPNNKIIATASQDKTAKLWNADSLEIIGILRGHTRGVWCVRFSPVDQVVMTSSSDCTIRIWSPVTLSCLKRLEQDCTILRAEFIDQGKHIISTSSDGLLKLWNIKLNECVSTLDEHTDRVWSLAVSSQSNKIFYSGGADSKFIKWRDNTEENRRTEVTKKQEETEQEQLLQNLLHEHKNLTKTFKLALNLDKPKTAYKILNEYVRLRKIVELKKLISELYDEQLATLIENIKAWSTNTKFSRIANLVLHIVIDDVLANPSKHSRHSHNMVEVLMPYVQRHFNRISDIRKDLTYVEFLINSM